VTVIGDMVGHPELWLVLLIALGLGLAVNAFLVFVALRPLNDLELTARRVWQGELDARVPASVVADAGIQRVGNTINILLDGLNADRTRLRTLANQVIQAGDRERASLARELHDSTAQTLAALLMELSVLAGENMDPRLEQRITRVRSIVTDVLDEVRMLAHTVHPRVLDDLGLVAALQLLARESVERGTAQVTYNGPDKVDAIDAACASALYRIAQEAVGNAMRHAQAKSISVTLNVHGGEAELEITDNGVGFLPDDVERRRPGMGLFTMRERAALVGGHLTLTTGAGKGTRVIARVPFGPTAHAPNAGLAVVGSGNSWRKDDV
jgi:signal transduction histidine kinase